MKPFIGIIVATKGRPKEVSTLLRNLRNQSVRPDLVVLSACRPEDIEADVLSEERVKVIFGPPGLPAQRNRGLQLIRETADTIIFFDDDFIPSKFWVQRAQELFES